MIAFRILALCMLLLAPAALAGSAGSPEVTDAAGDAPAPLDVVATWVTNDGSDLVFHVKVADLSQVDPLLGNSGDRYYYRVEFGLSTSTKAWYAEGQIHNVDTASRTGVDGEAARLPVNVGVGTVYYGGTTDEQNVTTGVVTVDAAQGILHIAVHRDGKLPATAGAIVTGIHVTTYAGSEPYQTQLAPGAQALVGGGRTLQDEAGPGLNYVIH